MLEVPCSVINMNGEERTDVIHWIRDLSRHVEWNNDSQTDSDAHCQQFLDLRGNGKWSCDSMSWFDGDEWTKLDRDWWLSDLWVDPEFVFDASWMGERIDPKIEEQGQRSSIECGWSGGYLVESWWLTIFVGRNLPPILSISISNKSGWNKEQENLTTDSELLLHHFGLGELTRCPRLGQWPVTGSLDVEAQGRNTA